VLAGSLVAALLRARLTLRDTLQRKLHDCCTEAEDFHRALAELLKSASEFGVVAADVNAGNLHRRTGGYPRNDHRMPQCCEALRAAIHPTHEVVTERPSGQGAPSRSATDCRANAGVDV
jgi:hypothetical protein